MNIKSSLLRCFKQNKTHHLTKSTTDLLVSFDVQTRNLSALSAGTRRVNKQLVKAVCKLACKRILLTGCARSNASMHSKEFSFLSFSSLSMLLKNYPYNPCNPWSKEKFLWFLCFLCDPNHNKQQNIASRVDYSRKSRIFAAERVTI